MSAFVFGSALDALTGVGCALVLGLAALFDIMDVTWLLPFSIMVPDNGSCCAHVADGEPSKGQDVKSCAPLIG